MNKPSPKLTIQEVIARQERGKIIDALFAVDNIYLNPNSKGTKIVNDYFNGVYATGDEAIKALDELYGIKR